jgi:hypothetical protein
MKNIKITKILLPIFGGVAVLLSGCHSVENQFLASNVPFLEAKTDIIPGLDPPSKRAKIIQEKGTKGATASEAEKEIYVAQLVYEYQTVPDPNMRREAVDALAKIPHPDRDRYLQEILRADENPFVRLSALDALGAKYSGSMEDLTALLIDRMKTDPDKDVRLRAVQILGDVCPKSSLVYKDPSERKLAESVVLELGSLLHDRVVAVRYESMRSLQKITGKDYGSDINRWLQYIRYTNGEVPELPSERSMTEKMPTVALPMFK